MEEIEANQIEFDNKIAESERYLEKILKENSELRERIKNYQGQQTKITEY